MAFLEVTFGAGGTYATLAAACNTVIPLNPNTHIDFLQVGDSTENAWIPLTLYNGGSPSFNYRVINTNPHQGNPNRGYKITLTGGGYFQCSRTGASTGQISLIDLNIYSNEAYGGETFLIHSSSPTPNDTAYTTLLNRCIIITTSTNARIIGGGTSCYLYDCKSNRGIPMGTPNPYIFENNTIDFVNANLTSSIFRNNVILSTLTAVGLSTGYNNAGIGWNLTDGLFLSGSGNDLGALVAADEFKSTTITDDDYLFIKHTGELADNGAVPSYVTQDIAGIPIPNYVERNGVKITEDVYPIGCHQGKYLPGTYRVVMDKSIQGVPDSGGRPLPVNFQYNEQYSVEEL